MGTDIHAGIEYRNGTETGTEWEALRVPNRWFGRWKDEPEKSANLHLSRDYRLFAILGNVRNGRGFAGCLTGGGFDPMSDNRGVPEGCTEEIRDGVLSGEHSATWVTLQEILDYDWTRMATLYGLVNDVQFEKWDRMKEWDPEPDSWCGDVMGGQTKKVSEEELREHVRVVMSSPGEFAEKVARLDKNRFARISWQLPYAQCAKALWTDVLPHMLPLAKVAVGGADGVRLVMDFDS